MESTKGGCSIAGLTILGLVALALIAYLVDSLAQWQDAETARLYAEQALVVAQGQARLDSAQAFAVTVSAILPWLVALMIGVACVVLLAAVVAMFGLSLAAIQGRPSVLPWSGRIPALDRPAQLVLPRLEGPDVIIIDSRDEIRH